MNIMIRKIYRNVKMSIYRWRYSLKNVDKSFYMGGASQIASDFRAGEFSFLGPGCIIYPMVEIGKYTMLAPQVKIIGGDHIYDKVSVPIIFAGRAEQKKTIIGDDVWIGFGSIIMRGVNIGNGSIIAANSVVTKDIPSYSIFGGNPAKFIRMRFTEEEIEKHENMLQLKNTWTVDNLCKNL